MGLESPSQCGSSWIIITGISVVLFSGLIAWRVYVFVNLPLASRYNIDTGGDIALAKTNQTELQATSTNQIELQATSTTGASALVTDQGSAIAPTKAADGGAQSGAKDAKTAPPPPHSAQGIVQNPTATLTPSAVATPAPIDTQSE